MGSALYSGVGVEFAAVGAEPVAAVEVEGRAVGDGADEVNKEVGREVAVDAAGDAGELRWVEQVKAEVYWRSEVKCQYGENR